jgi:hypothetical protein
MIVTADRLEPRTEDSPHPFVRSQVSVGDTEALLPDLPALEQAIKTVVQRL